MKWMIRLGLVVALAFVSSFVHAGALDVVFTQRNSTDSAGVQRIPPHPASGAGVVLFDPTTQQPVWALLGPGLTWDGTYIQASATGSTAWSSITGTPTTLSGYGITDAYPLSGNPSGFITSSALSPYLTSATAASTYATQSSLTSGLATKFNTPSGSTAQYLRGDGTLATFPSIPAAQVNTDWASNSGVSQLLNKPTTVAGYGITDAVTPSSLTTTLSGYATTSALTSGLAAKYNQPAGTTAQYIRGDGSLATFPALSSGTVTSVALTSSNLTVTGSPITTSGTFTIALPNVGTAGTYNTITTDPQGRVTAGTTRTRTLVTKAINTCFQLSTTRDADVVYNVEIVASGTLIGGQQGTIYLETFTDASCTTGTQEIMRATSGNTNALAVALGNVLTQTLSVSGPINAGEYAKIRTQNNTGTPTFTARPGWERLL